MQRLTLRDERGAVSVMVALLMVPLIGFAAIAVDLSAVYAERVQLQNGADAAALAIGADCARGACGSPQSTADALTEANYDEAGSTRGTPTVSLGAGQVTVTNPGVQSHWFAPVLGVDSTEVSASATVGWGAISTATAALPLTFSLCEFRLQTGGGAPSGTTERLIKLSKDARTDCTGPSNNVVPGGFGWVKTDPGGGCAATSSVGGRLSSDTGNVVPNACKDSGYLDGLVGTTILLPIFDAAGGNGNNAWYQVYGFAAFRLSGYFFQNKYQQSPGGCGKDQCLRGYFTGFVDLADVPHAPGAPDLGARVVYLTR